MSERGIEFTKMNGLGNDFVVIDGRSRSLAVSADLVRAIASRSSGVGCDQLIVIEPSDVCDFFMRIFNADGSEVGACGNATRCVASLYAPGFERPDLTIETHAGSLAALVLQDGRVRVDMGVPRFGWRDIPLAHEVDDTGALPLSFPLRDGRVLSSPSAVNVGNPHCIFWVDDVKSYDLGAVGGELEHHPLFPERANISLAEVRGGDFINLRVWERGAGLTLACGTAACAVAAAAAKLGKTGPRVTVALPGGELELEIQQSDGRIFMTGPATLEYEGFLQIEEDRFLGFKCAEPVA